MHRNGVGQVQSGTTLAVQASYDDGATWTPVTVATTGDHWTATLTHPAGGGFVSLKATAGDAAGNSVDQTILRAYALK